MDIAKEGIGNALTSKDKNHVIAVANDIYDETLEKYQSEINAEVGQGDGVYDISAAYPSASPFASLQDALTAFTDTTKQKPGMTIKFIDSESGKYVQYRLTKSTFSTDVADWERAFTLSKRIILGKNLFDKSQVINGTYIINYGSNNGKLGGPGTGTDYIVSPLIEIEEGETYYLSRPSLGNATPCVRFLSADKTTIMMPAGWSSYTGTGNTKITAPSGAKYVQFQVVFLSGGVKYGNIDNTQLEKGEFGTELKPYSKVVKEIVPYSNMPEEVTDFLDNFSTDNYYNKEQTNQLLSGKVDLETTIIKSKNLFDKSKVLDGYIRSDTGNITGGSPHIVSPLIEIEEGETYYLYRPNLGSAKCVRFVKANGTTPIKPVGWSSYEGSANTIITAPSEAKYVQFNVVFNTGNINNTQLEKGDSFTGPEEYYSITKKNVPYDKLPDELLNEIGDNKTIISIANSDKIGVFSTSFFQGYSMKNHHHLNHLSMLLDYIFYNYSKSGDNELQTIARIENNQVWLGSVPPSQWNVRYGIVMHQENSAALKNVDSDTVYYNSKMLATQIKSLGGQPIFSTEHDTDFNYYQGVLRLCNDEGYLFMNWGKKAKSLMPTSRFLPMWYSGHPSTRTGWMIVNGMLPYLRALPRPRQSIKLFRVREGIDTTNLSNLVFNDIFGRAERFVELGCGVTVLTSATEKYFDRLNQTSSLAFGNIEDEYQKIQSKQIVSFDNYALVVVTTPYDKAGISSFKLHLDSTGVSGAKILKLRQLTTNVSTTFVIAFNVSGNTDNLVGKKFTVTSGVESDTVKVEYTIASILKGMLITNVSSSGKTVSGTDVPVITSNDFDVNNITLSGTYSYPSPDYINTYNLPRGEWVNLNINEGLIDMSDNLPTCMDYDKVAILLIGESITVKDIYAEVSGTKEKTQTSIPICAYKKGQSIISDNLFADDTSWDDISEIETFVNGSEGLPAGINIVKTLKEGESIKQQVTLGNTIDGVNIYEPIKIQCRLVARYYPKLITSDTLFETSEITRQSFDMSDVAISIGKTQDDTNPTKVALLHYGTYWDEQIFDTFIDASQINYVKIECMNKNIQLAKFEMEVVN